MLLHGLGRSRAAMFVLENRLAVQGYEVHNLEYDSMQLSPRPLTVPLYRSESISQHSFERQVKESVCGVRICVTRKCNVCT